MRTVIFLAGLISAVAASSYPVTRTVIDCGDSHDPAEWQTVSAPPAPPAPEPTEDCVDSDSEWQQWSASCPVYTETAPPTWISMLPAADYSSHAAKWSTGPPADWCYYSYTTASPKTSAAPYPTAAPATTTVAGTGGYKPTTSAYATYTGAANSNAGSFAIAGVAAAVALVLA